MNRYESLATLNVTESASWSEVQRAYKDLLVKWHPDRFNGSPLMSSYMEEKCKAAGESFLYLKGLYDEGVLPIRPFQACSFGGNRAPGSGGIDIATANQYAAPKSNGAANSCNKSRSKVTNWKTKLFGGVKEGVRDAVGLILFPVEFICSLIKVMVGNFAVFSFVLAPLFSGCFALNTFLAFSERIYYVSSAISAATMTSEQNLQSYNTNTVIKNGGLSASYQKVKGQILSISHKMQ